MYENTLETGSWIFVESLKFFAIFLSNDGNLIAVFLFRRHLANVGDLSLRANLSLKFMILIKIDQSGDFSQGIVVTLIISVGNLDQITKA